MKPRILKFICPACGSELLDEKIDNVTVFTKVNAVVLKKNGEFDYLDYGNCRHHDGDMVGFECLECGVPLTDPEGHQVSTEDDLVAWLLDQPYNQEQEGEPAAQTSP